MMLCFIFSSNIFTSFSERGALLFVFYNDLVFSVVQVLHGCRHLVSTQ